MEFVHRYIDTKLIGKSPIALIAALSFALPSASLAAYGRVVSWADVNILDLSKVLRSQYASKANLFEPIIKPSVTTRILRDTDGRISQTFRIPREIRDAVAFWLRIYTEFTTRHVVIFDARHPELVYDVVDLRELARQSRNQVAFEVAAKARVASVMKAFRLAFKSLELRPDPTHPTREEKLILNTLKRTKHAHPIRELAKNLRSQTGQRDNILKGLLAAETFFPQMDQIFTSLNVPPELTRLSLVESSFNLHAISRTGAAGIWQFMPKSAKEFMSVDDERQIDERLSPLKATVAAARLLKRNHAIFGHWALAVTSYNHGSRKLPRLKPGKDGFSEIAALFSGCNSKSPLGWASRNYYAEFLAVLYAEAYRDLVYGDGPLMKTNHLAFFQLRRPQSAVALSIQNAISVREFKLLNPDIGNINALLPSGLWLALPAERDDFTGLLGDRIKRRPRLASVNVDRQG